MLNGNNLARLTFPIVAAKEKVLDATGWVNTGDFGMLLSDGSLILTGRAKDTIVLSSGENIEPGPLEECLIASPLIEQALLLGQDQKYLAALIVPRIDHVKEWLAERGVNSQVVLGISPENYELRQSLKLEMNQALANRLGSRREERLFSIALVEPFTIENGLLTQTLKQKREKIIQRDLKLINEIYGGNGTSPHKSSKFSISVQLVNSFENLSKSGSVFK